jgi:4-amino-4-deoxychorismate lyase
MDSYWYQGHPVQGNQLAVSIQEPGLLYGATVFSTLRVYDTLDHPLTDWQGHCDRIQHSLKTFHWQSPDWQRLRQGANWMATQSPVLRITVFPNGQELITGRALPTDLLQRQQSGIIAWVAETEFARSLPHHKTGNYLAPWLALQTAQRYNAQEAILINADGQWLETSTGTLWGWKDEQWWTPPLAAGILPGLARSHLISKLKCQNKEVRQQPWTSDLVQQFAAIAYTNCVVELVPIHTVLWGDAKLTYDVQHSDLSNLWQSLRICLFP